MLTKYSFINYNHATALFYSNIHLFHVEKDDGVINKKVNATFIENLHHMMIVLGLALLI